MKIALDITPSMALEIVIKALQKKVKFSYSNPLFNNNVQIYSENVFMSDGALANITVIELAQGVAGPYCGRLLAAHGARVIKVEPPVIGDSARNLLPNQQKVENGGTSGIFGWLNANKESIALDRNNAEDAKTILQLCQRAQLVIDDRVGNDRVENDRDANLSGDASEGCSPIDKETLGQKAPHCIYCNVSWYGQSGPYSQYAGSDALISALTGLAFMIGEAGGAPTLPSGYGSQVIAGTTAAIAVMTALISKDDDTQADDIDLSIFEAALVLNETGAIARSYELDSVPQRYGINRFPPTYPMGVFQCSDGWIGITALTPTQWAVLSELLQIPEYGVNPNYYASIDRFLDADALEKVMKPQLLKWSARDLVVAGQNRRVPLALVPTPDEALALPEFVERGAFSTLSLSDGTSFQGPGIPFILNATPADGSGSVPDIDQDRETVLAFLGTAAKDTAVPNNGGVKELAPAKKKPLQGLRVIDLSKGWAGPLTGRYCADLGAEVIKVEDCRYPDWWRGWEATQQWIDDKEYEKIPAFNSMNRNKYGITLDFTTSEGVELVKRLIKDADAVIENYTSTVLPGLGLDYAELKKINPEIVMMSMPAFGMTSPWSHHRAYGSTVEQASGLPHLNGEAEWPPTQQHVALGDAVAGINGAVALLIGLYHKQQTGSGQFIDLSQVECLLPLAAHGVIDYSLNQSVWPRIGSRHQQHAPHNVFRCDGEESWLAIFCEDNNQWQALANAIGQAELAEDRRFKNASDRKSNEQELDAIIGKWAIAKGAHEAMNYLQSQGVPAAVVGSSQNLVDDQQLQSRGYFEWAPGVHRDVVMYPLTAFTLSGYRQGVISPAPMLGEHNELVLKEKLGLTDDDINVLLEKKVIGTVPILPGG